MKGKPARDHMSGTGRPKISTRTWVIAFALLFLLLCGGTYALYHVDTGGTVVNVYRDGACIQSIDLTAVTGTQTYTFTDEDGHENVLQIENGKIRMIEANCPDQVCVDTGWVNSSLKPIVCLPARLVIQIETDAETEALALDAVSG